MKSYIENSIKSKLHSALTISDFWNQFVEAIVEELYIQQQETEKTKYFYDIYHALEDNLILLCKQFGYNPNLILNDSAVIPPEKILEYIRLQAKSIKYRIQNKTTYNGYMFNFNILGVKGNTYVAFFDNTKIVRSLEWKEIYNKLVTFSFDKPFIDIIPNQSLSFAINLKLDEGYIMDDAPPLKLDMKIDSTPTGHIFYEFILDKILEGNYLIDDRYTRYLEEASLYTKSLKHYVHCGIQLNIPLYTTDAYNFIHPNNEYTIPDLNLNTSIGYQYARRYVLSPFPLMDDGRFLDETLTYTMDGSEEVTNPVTLKDFYYISIGGGNHPLLNMDYASKINNPTNYIAYYSFNDEPNSLLFTDYSNLARNLTSDDVQTFKYNDFGNTVYFSGVPLYNLVISLINTNYTISFWYDPDMSGSNQYIFDLGFIKLLYNYTYKRLELFFENNTYYINNIDYYQHYINIELHKNDTLYFFIDTILVFSIPITQSYNGTHKLYIGSDSNKSIDSYFYGFINEFNIKLGFYTTNEKQYIYTNKVRLITKLHNFYNRVPLSNFEKAESSDGQYMVVTSYNKALFINNEFLFNRKNNIEIYNGITKYNNLIPKTVGVTIRYLSEDKYITATFKDNGGGFFESIIENDESYLISGRIDYLTGAYSVYLFSYKSIKNAQIFPFQSTNQVTASLYKHIKPLSINIFYTIGTVNFNAVDDGLGNILGYQVDIENSYVNYETGDFFIKFIEPTDNNTDVRIQYSYKITPLIDNGEPIFIEYNTYNNLEVTEVAIENQNKEIMVYATFPPIKFNSMYNYLDTAFLLKKLTI